MASVDRGGSVRCFPEQRGGTSPAYDIGQIAVSSSVFDPLEPGPTRLAVTGGLGNPPLDHSHPNRTSALLMPGLLGGGAPNLHTTIFKMQGWYAAGSVYETWTSVNAPNFSPPSGHSLSDIAVVAQVRT